MFYKNIQTYLNYLDKNIQNPVFVFRAFGPTLYSAKTLREQALDGFSRIQGGDTSCHSENKYGDKHKKHYHNCCIGLDSALCLIDVDKNINICY